MHQKNILLQIQICSKELFSQIWPYTRYESRIKSKSFYILSYLLEFIIKIRWIGIYFFFEIWLILFYFISMKNPLYRLKSYFSCWNLASLIVFRSLVAWMLNLFRSQMLAAANATSPKWTKKNHTHTHTHRVFLRAKFIHFGNQKKGGLQILSKIFLRVVFAKFDIFWGKLHLCKEVATNLQPT